MSPKDADGMANSVDPDQTAPFLYLSENLIRIIMFSKRKMLEFFLLLLNSVCHQVQFSNKILFS